MVAPSLPDRPDGGSPVRSAAPAPADEEREAAVTDLAAHWAALASSIRPSRPGLVVRLAALLRRLAAASRDEQFWALRARVLGGELLRSGLCGEWSGPHHPAEDVLPATLGLLRDRLPRSSAFPGAARSGSPQCWTRWRRVSPARCATACAASTRRTCAGGSPRPSHRTC